MADPLDLDWDHHASESSYTEVEEAAGDWDSPFSSLEEEHREVLAEEVLDSSDALVD